MGPIITHYDLPNLQMRRGPRPARLRKRCYNSCNTDPFEGKRLMFFFLMLGRDDGNEIFDKIGEKLLPTKAAPIASLNLSIIYQTLGKNMT